MDEINAYPLAWPAGWPRTPTHTIERSRFDVTPDRARRELIEEIRRLVGSRFRRDEVILSTNLKLRLDGEPYATQRPPDDQGVAVYFTYGKRHMVFACDCWGTIKENMRAIQKTIEALRGIERWGASDMLERAFTGFVALEHKGPETYADVLQMGNRTSETDAEWLAEAERNYRLLRVNAHPDKGGAPGEFEKLTRAIEQAREALS